MSDKDQRIAELERELAETKTELEAVGRRLELETLKFRNVNAFRLENLQRAEAAEAREAVMREALIDITSKRMPVDPRVPFGRYGDGKRDGVNMCADIAAAAIAATTPQPQQVQS